MHIIAVVHAPATPSFEEETVLLHFPHHECPLPPVEWVEGAAFERIADFNYEELRDASYTLHQGACA